jgi:hypothetical protein
MCSVKEMVMPMPWENIGACGPTGNESWMRFQLEWAAAYIREVCGNPPKGCEVGIMGQDTDYGIAETVGLCWDQTEISDAPWNYIANAELALRAFDDERTGECWQAPKVTAWDYLRKEAWASQVSVTDSPVIFFHAKPHMQGIGYIGFRARETNDVGDIRPRPNLDE